MMKSAFVFLFLVSSGTWGACTQKAITPEEKQACAVKKDLFFGDLLKNHKDEKSALPQLLVFVSFSMPEQSLNHLSKELEKIGGALVVRGLIDNSFKRTAQFLSKARASVMIDPTLFERFQITTVPTFIYAKEIPHGESSTPIHDRLMGHVTLQHALREFHTKGEVGGADRLLTKLVSRNG